MVACVLSSTRRQPRVGLYTTGLSDFGLTEREGPDAGPVWLRAACDRLPLRQSSIEQPVQIQVAVTPHLDPVAALPELRDTGMNDHVQPVEAQVIVRLTIGENVEETGAVGVLARSRMNTRPGVSVCRLMRLRLVTESKDASVRVASDHHVARSRSSRTMRRSSTGVPTSPERFPCKPPLSART